MAGYSGTPLIQKLGIKPGHVVCFPSAPDDWQATLGPMPADCTTLKALSGKQPVDVFVAFALTHRDLDRYLKTCHPRMQPAAGLWIAWPKKASGVKTELTEDVIRNAALKVGLVDNKVCAIDETWSGLRLVIRVKDRPSGKK